MAERELPFFTQTAVLDKYLKMSDVSASPEAIDLIASSLRSKPELYAYFFRNRPDPFWAAELLLRGYFVNTPELIETIRGFQVPRWEEQEYLISVSPVVPQVVVEHVKRINGHVYYYMRALEALKLIPPKMIESVIPVILKWIDDANIAPHVSLGVLELINRLAEDNNQSAFILFQRVTTPIPSNKAQIIKGHTFNSSAMPLFQLDDFQGRTLKKSSVLLFKVSKDKTISILETQLCEALRVEAETSNDPDYKSRSFWRTAIEDSGQDIVKEYKDKLLSALRDSLEMAVQENPEDVVPLIERYLAEPHEILRRLGLHILNRFPGQFESLVASELLKQENMDNVGIHHEYFTLLENGYPHLRTNEQEQLVNVIIMGMPQEKLDLVSKWSEYDSPEERKSHEDTRSKLWSRDRLWMLKEYLDGEPKVLLAKLITEFGSPEHPAFTHWISGGFAVSDVSPVTMDDLSRKSNDELLEYLNDWKPIEEGRFGPERESYGALGREVASLLLGDIERYEPLVIKIASIHADFATALINASAPDCDFLSALDLRLSICEHLLTNDHIRISLEAGANGNWTYFRFAAVLMCGTLLATDRTLRENDFLRLRDLLLILANDPDPNFETDRPKEGWVGNNDPLTVAINHVRSRAILSLIQFGVNAEVERSKEGGLVEVRELDAMIKDVLTAKLRRENDFSLAVHSVFGRELNRLYWMDKKWVEDHIDEIFPPHDDEESIAFYVAAWDSYVVSTPSLFLELFTLLHSQYERAIGNISKGYVTKTHLQPVEALSHHLLLEYQLADYNIKSSEGQASLITKFFMECLPNQRGTAAWALNERTHQHPNEWQRAKELWNWRLEIASKANFASDFKPEMEAFSQLVAAAPDTENITTLWPLLEGFLPYLGETEDWSRIWHNLQKYLAREVERDPVGVIRFYNLMHDSRGGPMQYYGDEGRKIMTLGALNEDSRNETLLLIDKLNRKGNYEFRDIQEQLLK